MVRRVCGKCTGVLNVEFQVCSPLRANDRCSSVDRRAKLELAVCVETRDCRCRSLLEKAHRKRNSRDEQTTHTHTRLVAHGLLFVQCGRSTCTRATYALVSVEELRACFRFEKRPPPGVLFTLSMVANTQRVLSRDGHEPSNAPGASPSAAHARRGRR